MEDSVIEPDVNEELIDNRTKLPYYCYLAINEGNSQKVNTRVGVSRYPPNRVQMDNEKYEQNKKNKNNPTSPWVLNMIIGDFTTRMSAEEFRKEWLRKSRGIKSRRYRGLSVAYWKYKRCYDAELVMFKY